MTRDSEIRQLYSRYANCTGLGNFLNDRPQVFQKLVDSAIKDVAKEQKAQGDAFPSSRDQETPDQEEKRHAILQSWMEVIGYNNFGGEEVDKLTRLFYLVPEMQLDTPESLSVIYRPPGASRIPGYSAGRTGGQSGSRCLAAANDQKLQEAYSIKSLSRCHPLLLLDSALNIVKASKLKISQNQALSISGQELPTELSKYFRQPFWHALLNFDLDLDKLLPVGGDVKSPNPGIYLHILWHTGCQKYDFYAYVGQSRNLGKRIDSHNDIWYRHKHPSLHYHIWDTTPGINSAFIILVDIPDATQLQLNLLEFWSCLILQCLPKAEHERFAPGTYCRPGRGLNVANPLWQNLEERQEMESFSKHDKFTEMIKDADTTRKEYLQSLVRAWNELQHSPNCDFRAYFTLLCLRRQQLASDAKTEKSLQHFLQGHFWPIKIYNGTSQLIVFNNMKIRIRKQYAELQSGSTVHMQGFLYADAQADCYAEQASKDDPASRLKIRITCEDQNTNHRLVFIRAGGWATVQDVNELVERLDARNDKKGNALNVLEQCEKDHRCSTILARPL